MIFNRLSVFFNKQHTISVVKKHNAISLLFTLIIALQVAVCLFWANSKTGLFIDEIHSFGLSNSEHFAFLNRDTATMNSWLDKDHFHKYLTVQNDGKFNYVNVYRNQAADVHPPLFYIALHTVCSFFPDSCSKWYGIVLNILFFIITQIILLKISMRMTGNNVMLSSAVLIFYGSTMLAIDNVLFIRMYMMLTMFAVLTCDLHLKMFCRKVDFKNLLPVFFITYAGCMTQYYFAIFAFFLSAVLCLCLLFEKKIKELLFYASTILLSVGCFLITYSPVFDHMFNRKVGAQNLDNALQILKIPQKCCYYAAYFGISLFSDNIIFSCAITALLFMLATVLAVMWFKRYGKDTLKTVFHSDFYFLATVVILTFVTVSLVSFDAIPRYMYFIYPLMILLVTIFFSSLFSEIFKKRSNIVSFSNRAILAGALCLGIINLVFRKPSMLFEAEYKSIKMIETYNDRCGIFFTRNNYSGALTQECRAVMQLKEVYCTEPENMEKIKCLLNEKNFPPLIIWVDKDNQWGSGYDPEKITAVFITNSMYTTCKKLYSYGLVDCYIVN